MTNFEKYRDSLLKIEGSFAVDKNSKKIAGCDTTDGVKSCINCSDCIFDAGDCFESDKIEWLYKEYEPPVLSDDDFEFIKVLEKIKKTKYKFIAKSSGGQITFFTRKPSISPQPIRTGNYYYYTNRKNYVVFFEDTKDLFQGIKSKDGLYDIENKCFIKEYMKVKIAIPRSAKTQLDKK